MTTMAYQRPLECQLSLISKVLALPTRFIMSSSEETNIFKNALAILGIKKPETESLSRSSSISSLSDLGKQSQRFSPASSPMLTNEDDMVCRICECYVSLEIFRDHTHDCAIAHEIAEKCHGIEHKLAKLEPLLGELSRHASRESLASSNSSSDHLKIKSANSSPHIHTLAMKKSNESLPDLSDLKELSNLSLNFNLFKSSGSLTVPNSPLQRPSGRKYSPDHFKRDLHVLIIKYRKLEWSEIDTIVKCDKYFDKLQQIKIELKLNSIDTTFDSIADKAQILFHDKRKCLDDWQIVLKSHFLDFMYLKNLQKQYHQKKSIVTSFFNVLLRKPKQRRSSHELRKNSINNVDITDFKILKPISKGAFGSVFLSRKTNTNDIFAIKIMKKDEMVGKNMVNHVLAERKVLSVLSSEFIVRMFYAFQSQNHLYLVMEYLCGGDLSSLLSSLGSFSTEMTLQYSAEIALALEYLHAQGIIHRDIKPDNVLIDHLGHCKLTDFGLSSVNVKQLKRKKSVIVRKKQQVNVIGTPDYLAPELLLGYMNDRPVDYWALGCCIYEFIEGTPPFHDDNPDQIFQNIINHQLVFYDCSTDMQLLIRGLLRVSAKDRFNISHMKQDPCFAKFNEDWSTIRDNEPPFIPKVDEEDVAYFDERNNNIGPVIMDAEELMKEGEELMKEEGGGVFEQFSFKNVKQLKELNQDSSSMYDSSDYGG